MGHLVAVVWGSQSDGVGLEAVQVDEDVESQDGREENHGDRLGDAADQQPGSCSKTGEEVLDRLLVGRIVEPVFDYLLAQDGVEVPAEALAEVPEPVEHASVEGGESLDQFDRLVPHRWEHQRRYRQQERCQNGKRDERPDDPVDPDPLQPFHQRLQQEYEPGGKGDR